MRSFLTARVGSRTNRYRAWLVEWLLDLRFFHNELVKPDGVVHQDLFSLIHRYHVLQRMSPAPDRLGPGRRAMRVIGRVHDFIHTDLIAASDAVALMPESAPHVGAKNFTGLFGESS